MGLNHLPSGKFAANGAWLAVQVIAHNLARWTARLGLGEGIVTTKTLRRRLFGLVGRLTRSARKGVAAPAGSLALGDRLWRRPRATPGDPAPRLIRRSPPPRAAPGLASACPRVGPDNLLPRCTGRQPGPDRLRPEPRRRGRSRSVARRPVSAVN